jgi:hypothetical protein
MEEVGASDRNGKTKTDDRPQISSQLCGYARSFESDIYTFVIRIVFKIIKFWLDKTHLAKRIAGIYSLGLKSTGVHTSIEKVVTETSDFAFDH